MVILSRRRCSAVYESINIVDRLKIRLIDFYTSNFHCIHISLSLTLARARAYELKWFWISFLSQNAVSYIW